MTGNVIHSKKHKYSPEDGYFLSTHEVNMSLFTLPLKYIEWGGGVFTVALSAETMILIG